MARLVSIIISAYNEEETLRTLCSSLEEVWERTEGSMPDGDSIRYELLFVNDGSTDATSGILRALREEDPSHISVISLSKNFGHEAAMTAGLDYAAGDILIFMDADMQHPPKLIPEIIEKFDEGFEIVSMVRTENHGAGGLRNFCSNLFYRLINRLSGAEIVPGASDFFAISGRVASVLRSDYRMKVRFMRGFVQNVGFKKTSLEYEAARRSGGSSHYSLGALISLFRDVIVSFSDVPLKMGIYLGLFAGLLGMVLIVYTFATRGTAPGGYATIVITLCFMSAAIFMVLGIIGSYISLLYREIRDIPIYIAENIETIEKTPEPETENEDV